MDIKLNKIYKRFKDQQVLKNVSMSFSKGQTTCIMGDSGAGKTTLIYILMGLEKAESGTIRGIEGKKISAVFQEDRLIEHWDAIKNIMLVSSKDISEEMVRENLMAIGLTEFEGKAVRSLSGGMRRRVAIVRAILADYDIIIMDEPFKGLNEDLKKQVINYVKEKTKEKTSIIITHDKEEVSMLEAKLINLPF